MIEITDNTAQVVDKVNTGFGSEVITLDDSAAEAVAALNTAFAGVGGVQNLTVNDDAADFVDKLNQNLELYNDQGSDVQFKFLHISDTHGYSESFEECVSLLGNGGIDRWLLTGDLTAYRLANYDYAVQSLNAAKGMGDKLLMCPGNHDTYDNKHTGYGGKANQVCETAWLHDCMGNYVNWGDTNGNDNVPLTAGYWYKDMSKGGKTLRIIGLDQYEIGTGGYSVTYHTVYSQKQVDWLLDLLYNTPSNYYIIIMMHEPAVQSPVSSSPTDYDAIAAGMAACNLFTSELLAYFGNRRNEPSLNLLPQIMRAYLHQENLVFAYNNKDNKGGHGTLTVAKDFRNHTPATFLFYIGGHQHQDICGYIPYADWNDQLMLYIAAGDSRVPYAGSDDLLWNYNASTNTGQQYATSEPTYRINEVTIDFSTRSITVKRIGNKTTALYDSTNGAARPHGGRVRDQITFPFKKGGV